MKLYFNSSTKTFSTTQEETFDEVFESYDCKRHEKETTEISLDIFTIKIRRDNWEFAREGSIQWLWIDVYIHDVLLLPISMSCRKADIHYHFSEHEITFQQYGAGHNVGKCPHTYMQARKSVDWEEALSIVVDICNNYEEWVVHQAQQLISTLIAHKKYKYWDIATLLNLCQRYDEIAPNIVPVYREFVDEHCFHAMTELVKHIENNKMDEVNKRNKMANGDAIWGYIRQYHLDK